MILIAFTNDMQFSICTKIQSANKKFFKRGDLLAQEKEAHLESLGKQNVSTSTPEKSADLRKC